jgi:hypothetical protein
MPPRSKKGKPSGSGGRKAPASAKRKSSSSKRELRAVSAAAESSPRDQLRVGFEQLRAHVGERFEQLRAQMREDFEQLAVEIGEPRADDRW